VIIRLTVGGKLSVTRTYSVHIHTCTIEVRILGCRLIYDDDNNNILILVQYTCASYDLYYYLNTTLDGQAGEILFIRLQ